MGFGSPAAQPVTIPPGSEVDITGSSVTIAGGTVALAAGTAVDITAGTVDLTVPTQQGVAGQIALAGAPPIDLESRLQVQRNALGSVTLGAYNISSPNSVTCFIDCSTVTGSTQVALLEYSAANPASPLASEQVQAYGAMVPAGCIGVLTVPAHGNSLIVDMVVPGTHNAKITISGGTRTISKPDYFVQTSLYSAWATFSDMANNEFIATANVNPGVGGEVSAVVSSRAGPVQITCNPGGPGVMFVSSACGGGLYAETTLAGGALAVVDVVQPRDGLLITIENSGATGKTYAISVVSQDAS